MASWLVAAASGMFLAGCAAPPQADTAYDTAGSGNPPLWTLTPTITIAKIADSSTVVPGGSNGILSASIGHNDTTGFHDVMFVTALPNGQLRFYSTFGNDNFAFGNFDTTTAVIYDGYGSDGSHVAYVSSNNPGVTYELRTTRNGSYPTVILSSSTAVPGGVGMFGNSITQPSIEGQVIAFQGAGTGDIPSYPAIWRDTAGTLEAVIHGGSTPPLGTLPIVAAENPALDRDGTIVAVVYTNDGGAGIYRTTSNGLQVVADTVTVVPALTAPFQDFGQPSADDGTIAFDATYGNGGEAVAADFGSGVQILATLSTPVPGSSAHFTTFERASASGDLVVFHAETDAGIDGLYGWHGGSLFKIVDQTDTLVQGYTTQNLTLMRDGVSGHEVAFTAYYGLSGVFKATLEFPEPQVITDTDEAIADLDGTLVPSEYAGRSQGVGAGFGGVAGDGSSLYVDSSECGGIVLGFEKGAGGFNDELVMYIDAFDGEGVTSTASLSDTGDTLRKAISGTNGSLRATLEFPYGFDPDYAIAMNAGSGGLGFAGLWGIYPGTSHEFVRALAGDPPQGASDGFVELGFDLDDIGLSPGMPFSYVVTYLNADNDLYRSNEFHGVKVPPDGNLGQSTYTMEFADYVVFQPVQASAPAVEPDEMQVDHGGQATLDVTDNDSDPSGIDPSDVVIIGSPAHGSVTVGASGVTYTHDGSDTTDDSFTYQVPDGCGLVSETATVTVTIDPADTGDTGGDTGDTGGDTGDTADTGGDTGDTGGDTADTGGDTGDTGGDTADTGGDTGDTGGDTADSGGDTADTGGDTADTDTGGDTADTDTGGDTADTGDDTADTDTGSDTADTDTGDTDTADTDTGGDDTGGDDTGGPLDRPSCGGCTTTPSATGSFAMFLPLLAGLLRRRSR